MTKNFIKSKSRVIFLKDKTIKGYHKNVFNHRNSLNKTAKHWVNAYVRPPKNVKPDTLFSFDTVLQLQKKFIDTLNKISPNDGELFSQFNTLEHQHERLFEDLMNSLSSQKDVLNTILNDELYITKFKQMEPFFLECDSLSNVIKIQYDSLEILSRSLHNLKKTAIFQYNNALLCTGKHLIQLNTIRNTKPLYKLNLDSLLLYKSIAKNRLDSLLPHMAKWISATQDHVILYHENAKELVVVLMENHHKLNYWQTIRSLSYLHQRKREHKRYDSYQKFAKKINKHVRSVKNVRP